jgi:hypothetical protein
MTATATAMEATMKAYVDKVCKDCATNGVAVATARILPPLRYHDGAGVAPLGFEPNEFCGVWFVQFGVAVDAKFVVCRLDLGQARFRFTSERDVQYPGAIRKSDADVKRDDLIEAGSSVWAELCEYRGLDTGRGDANLATPLAVQSAVIPRRKRPAMGAPWAPAVK